MQFKVRTHGDMLSVIVTSVLILVSIPASSTFALNAENTNINTTAGYQDGKNAAIMDWHTHNPGMSLISGAPSCHAGPPCTQLDIAYHNFHQGYHDEWTHLCKSNATAAFQNTNTKTNSTTPLPPIVTHPVLSPPLVPTPSKALQLQLNN